MKAIILAAGRGVRLRHMTNSLPKCLAVVINGKSLLATQIDTLCTCGINPIAIVRGYQAEKISVAGARYYFNDDYLNNNILESLFYAEKELDGDVIISYSDIWYSEDMVKKLMSSQQDIALAVDVEWKGRYQNRKDHPTREAEGVIFNSEQVVVKIGKIADECTEIQGEFTGLMKLSRAGCEVLRHHYHQAKHAHEGKPFQRAKIFKKAYLTDLFQEMADSGLKIHCEIVGPNWREIDTIEDFENAVEFLGR